MWLQPRQAIRTAIEEERENEMYLLTVLGGLITGFDNLSDQGIGDTMILPFILLLWLIAGCFGGFISLYVVAGLLRWTGSWFGGKASFRELQFTYAWSFIPLLPSLGVVVILIGYYGRSMFSSEGPAISGSIIDMVLLGGAFIIIVVLTLWAVVSFFRALSEVQAFNIWKALGSVIIPFLGLIAIFAGIGFLMK